jgi:hypothetical protein
LAQIVITQSKDMDGNDLCAFARLVKRSRGQHSPTYSHPVFGVDKIALGREGVAMVLCFRANNITITNPAQQRLQYVGALWFASLLFTLSGTTHFSLPLRRRLAWKILQDHKSSSLASQPSLRFVSRLLHLINSVERRERHEKHQHI